MILDNVGIKVEKSGNFESTDFRIDGKYKNKILWMLINQYRFKIRTPVQEIISNARDAQRENGNPDTPIKIQLPTRIEPTFKVRDFGVGMDEYRIKNIFTSIGASTKNADNSQTGGFGIGAKSPLAYTNSFTIKTWVDGTYWVYVVAKTEDEGIGIHLLDTGTTTEENGTEIQIPVNKHDVRDFSRAACRCTMFWEVQPVFNLDDEDLCVMQNGTKISGNLTIFNKEDLDGMFASNLVAVVDGIPYELDYNTINDVRELCDIKDMLNYSTQAVLFLNTGDIDLLQTRESIEDTEKTTQRLTEMGQIELTNVKTYIDSCFNEKTLEGRIKQYNDVSEKFRDIGLHKFATFIINSRNFSHDKDLSTLEYSYKSKARYSQKRGGTVATLQRHIDDNIWTIADLGKFYWDDLKDSESDTMKNRRMRNHLTTTGEKAILITQNNADNGVFMRTLKLLKVKKLSSLEQPAKAVRGAKSTKAKIKVPNYISIYVLNGGYRYYNNKVSRTNKNVNFKENVTKFVYCSYSDKTNYVMEDMNFVKILLDEYNLVACRIPKTDLKHIENNKDFIHIDNFMKTFKPTKWLFESLLSRVPSNDGLVKMIVVKNKIIADKVLTKLAQCVILEKRKGFSRTVKFSIEMKVEMQEKFKKELAVKETLAVRFDTRLKQKYPMASENKGIQDNINYINSTYKAR